MACIEILRDMGPLPTSLDLSKHESHCECQYLQVAQGQCSNAFCGTLSVLLVGHSISRNDRQIAWFNLDPL